jgi:hypothetical protein
MSDQDPTTKPTLDTLLEMLRGMRDEMRAGFSSVNKRLDDLDVRVDRVESVVNATRSEMLTLRADFKELRSTLREHLPAVN